MTILNIGRVRLGWTGEWDALIDYTAYDAVTYEGGSYACTTDSAAGILPTNTTYWQVMALKGIVGDTGDAGSNGTNGTDGSTGPQGIQGIAGDTGPQGTQGLTGSQGATGSQGLKGDIGVTGNTGPQGTQGIQGTEGIQGIIGVRGQKVAYGANTNTYITNSTVDPTGDIFFNTDGNVYEITGPNSGNHNNLGAWEAVDGINGEDGATGATGAAGTNGTDGATGPQGIDGPTGTQGAMGNTGPTGTTGATGTEGPQGSTGLKGDTGAVGSQGVQGIDGPQGPDGPVGDTAYEEAVAAGFAGTESAWLTSLIGDDGPQGSQGIQGSQGLKGDIGTTGAKGDQGVQGTQGIEGDTGPQGTQGIKGDTGTTGAVGDQGIQGTKGNTGNTGSQGPIGNDGPVGLTGADSTVAGPTGPTGPEGSAANVDTTNVAAAGALMDSEVDADIKTLELPASTTISTFGASLVDDLTATAARSTLGLGTAATTAATAYATAAQGTAADNAAPLASPTFTGTPAGPTATVGTDTTQLATTAFVLANGSSSSVAALSAAATVDISLASADYFTLTLDQNTTLTVSDVSAVDTFNLALTGYTVSAAYYDIDNAAYDSVSLSVASQDTAPYGVEFSSDGTKMFMLGSANDAVFQYSLSTAWDASTASYDSVSLSVSGQDTQPFGIAFSSDGTKMFMVGIATDAVYQYSLSTAWNLSTASYDSVSFSVSQDTQPTALAFKTDGTKMYVVGTAIDRLFQYSLSTAWDLSTASYDSVNLYLASQDGNVYDIAFSSDGTRMLLLGNNSDAVFQYALSTAWNLSTASYDSVSFSVASQESQPTGMTFSADGTKMYVCGFTNDTVYQYSTGSIVPATVTYPASFNFPAGTPPAAPLGGTKNILEGQSTDGGTSWNVTQLGADFS
jgi:hypothetical protein